MYLSRDGLGNETFVPEDGAPKRDFVPVDPVRSVDPPARRGGIYTMPPGRRATALVQTYIESRVGCKDKGESRACRGFLKAWHAIQADGNEMGIQLSIMRANGPCVQFYFLIPGVGPVTWLPVLVTQGNDRTHHLLRETGPNRLAVAPSRPAPAEWGDTPRKAIPPKADTVLIKGKRL